MTASFASPSHGSVLAESDTYSTAHEWCTVRPVHQARQILDAPLAVGNFVFMATRTNVRLQLYNRSQCLSSGIVLTVTILARVLAHNGLEHVNLSLGCNARFSTSRNPPPCLTLDLSNHVEPRNMYIIASFLRAKRPEPHHSDRLSVDTYDASHVLSTSEVRLLTTSGATRRHRNMFNIS